MLRKCTENEFRQYVDFFYALALDLTRSAYPTYCDGIKTKDMFIERLEKAFERDSEQMLLFEREGKVEGLVHFYWIKEDSYLETNAFCISKGTKQALEEFLEHVQKHFGGYDLFMGFPAENQAALEYLSQHGFECIEDDYNNTAYLDRLDGLAEDKEIIRITKENYRSFQILHSQIEGDMYWNSERILEDMENWTILVRQEDNKPQGAVYYRDLNDGWYEIFGIDIDQDKYRPDLYKQLLNAALYNTRNKGGRVMTFFCEKEYQEVALACGFACVGNYLCYKKHIV